jgi:glucosamine-6-phosphate deaminase
MSARSDEVVRFGTETLKVEIYASRKAAGEAAARAAAETMKQLGKGAANFGVIFATGASQLDTLRELVALADIPWGKVDGFHMDEYEGISAGHPASFRRYMREHLTERVQMHAFHEIDGGASDPGLECRTYAEKLRACNPQLCLLGIGENGHLAFNDPGEAKFGDPDEMRVVNLDDACRRQQVGEGWFASPEAVPRQALTLTIPTLLRVPRLVVSVPGSRKARIVRRTLEEAISTACPATILRTHPDATLYLDRDAAGELGGWLDRV